MTTADHTKRGKWSVAGLPHKGWSCVDVSDLGEPSKICEMCESAEVRFVHIMEHKDFPGALEVGCVCAEHMENDYVRPRRREKRLRAAARRRKAWASKTWKVSFKGNQYINLEGFNIVIVPSGGRPLRWRILVTNRQTNRSRPGRLSYETIEQAKHAALNALIWSKEHLT